MSDKLEDIRYLFFAVSLFLFGGGGRPVEVAAFNVNVQEKYVSTLIVCK